MGWLIWAAIYVTIFTYFRQSKESKEQLMALLVAYRDWIILKLVGIVRRVLVGDAVRDELHAGDHSVSSLQYADSPQRGPRRVDTPASHDYGGIYHATPGRGRRGRSTSRHGFVDGDIDPDEDDGDDGISPLTQHTWNSRGSKHGFYDEDDDMREDLHYHSDRSAGKSQTNKSGLFPASPDASLRGTRAEDVSPLSSASYSTLRRRMIRRRVSKDADSIFSEDKENLACVVTEQMLELYSNTNSLALDLMRRDELREKDLQQAAGRREILFETNSQTQQSLMQKYEEEESRIEDERKRKVSEIHDMLRNNSGALDIGKLSGLLKEARTHTMPLATSDVSAMESLVVACGSCVDETKRLFDLAYGNEMVEKETFSELEGILESTLGRRMVAAGNETLRRAKSLVDDYNRQRALEEEAAAKEKDRLEAAKVVLPMIPGLDNLLADIKADSFLKDKSVADLLESGSRLCEVMVSSQVQLSKEQRYLLWRTVFGAVVGSAAAMKAEVEVLQFTVVIFGVFFSMKKGYKKYSPGSYRMLHEVLAELSPVLVPKMTIMRGEVDEEVKFLRSREARLRIATLYGSITAVEIETNASVVDAWAWLTRLTKYLRRTITVLSQKEAPSEEAELLKGDIVEGCRAIRNYLRLAGPLLLLKYRPAILAGASGLLPCLQSICKDAITLQGVSGTADSKSLEGKMHSAVTNLVKLVDGTLASGVFDSVPFYPVCYLSAQMARAYTATMKKRVAEIRAGADYKAQERVRNSIPHRLLRVPGLLTKEGKVDLVKQLIVDTSQQQPELLTCGLATVAEEIVKKCTDDQFIHTNLANPLEIATIITDLCASKLGSSFGNLIKNEFNMVCPMTIPSLDTSIKQERMQKVICTFALCCVQDGNALSLSDAWEWVANMTNLASREATLHRDIAEGINSFLRVVSERMLQAFGKPYKQVIFALSEKVLPIVEDSVERKRLKEFLEKFRQGQIAPIFVDN